MTTVTIKSRDKRELLKMENVDTKSTTVLDFKKSFLKNCKDASAKGLSVARLRFTVNEA